jgi:hypothetical protein
MQIQIKTIFNLLILILFTNTITAQKAISPLVEKDNRVLEAMKNGSEDKSIVSYDVMQNIMQNDFAKQIKFEVSVANEQKVIVEIFNENGDLIEVIYNDFMLPKEKTKFWLSGKKWNSDLTYYLRVTSEDTIENHEIVFDDY